MQPLLRVLKLAFAWSTFLAILLALGLSTRLCAKRPHTVTFKGYLNSQAPAPLRFERIPEPFDRMMLIPHCVPKPEDALEAAHIAPPPLPESIGPEAPPQPQPEPLPQLIHDDPSKTGHAAPTALGGALSYFKYRVPLKDGKSVQFILPTGQRSQPEPKRSEASYQKH